MNENFKKLLEQSYSKAFEECIQRGHQVKQIDAIFNSIVMDEFAELIVRECMRMCEVAEMSFVTHDCDVEASGAITVKQFIAEHFGVE